jgi:uncharacterized protein (TIGR03118 family)
MQFTPFDFLSGAAKIGFHVQRRQHMRRFRSTGGLSSRRRSYLPTIEELGERCLLSGFVQTNLISDVPGLAQVTDPSLVNPWGIAGSSVGSFVFADNNSGLATANSATFPAVDVAGRGWTGSPTGAVFNPGHSFAIANGNISAPSVLLFASEDGTISGWNPFVSADKTIVAFNNSLPGNGPVYTGLTLGNTASGTFLYVANFRAGAIDVFDQSLHPVSWPGAFSDPNLPPGYVPFNIQDVGSSLYVTFTQQNGGQYDRSTGAGNGYVDRFDVHGQLEQRLASQGPLDAPWGVAVAPSNFGPFAGAVLVGNFGNGRINAFDPNSGDFLGTLADPSGDPITVPGLWSLRIGNDGVGASTSLFFTAGIGAEQAGLFGMLQPGGQGVVESAEFTRQQRILNAIDSQPPGVDEYPLPPAQGPTLQQTTRSTGPALVAPFALDSSFALVPILAATPTSQASPPIAPVPSPEFLSASASQRDSTLLLVSTTGAHASRAEQIDLSARPIVNRCEQPDLPAHGVITELRADIQMRESNFCGTTTFTGSDAWSTHEPQQRTPATSRQLDSPPPVADPAFGNDPSTASLAMGGAPDDTSRPVEGFFGWWISRAAIGLLFTGCLIRWVKGRQPEPGAVATSRSLVQGSAR